VGAIDGGPTGGGDDDGWITNDDCATTEDSNSRWSTDDDGLSTEDEEEALTMHVLRCQPKRRIATAVLMLGMYHYDKYMNKATYRIPLETGYQWTMRTLGHRRQCYNMFRIHRDVFDSLHNLLVGRYGLESAKKMSSIEVLAIFLWMCGAPQSMRQANNRFERSLGTCSNKFDKVLDSVMKLATDIIRSKDPEFITVHRRLQSPRFDPYFDNCIGAIDETHVPVIVPTEKVVQYTGRKGITTQNVLALCDFDMRFTFVVAGWPDSVHDVRVFNDALKKFGNKFPHPPEGMHVLYNCFFVLVVVFVILFK
jgi:hypothetical protein